MRRKKVVKKEPIKHSYENWWENNLGKDHYVHNGRKIRAPNLKNFHLWMGNPQQLDRLYVREKFGKFDTFLDAGCGGCPEYFGLVKLYGEKINYTGLDLTQKIVDHNKSKNINCVKGSLNNIPFKDNEFEIVHSRHVVEHMKEIEKPLTELIRVCRKKLFISFFIDPMENTELDSENKPFHKILLENENTSGEIYHNQYNKLIIEKILNNNEKISNFKWFKFPEKLHSKSLLEVDIVQ